MAKYKAPGPEPEVPKRKTVVPGWARKYQREEEKTAEERATQDRIRDAYNRDQDTP